MIIPTVSKQAQLKGLQLVATGDVLNKEWLEHLKKHLVEEDGCFREEEAGTYFVLAGEVNDADNVHHIFFMPDFASVDELRSKLMRFGRLDGNGFGRPMLNLHADQIAEFIIECNGILGPAHAFTPYYSVFSHFDSLKHCYKDFAEQVGFIELGLSADSYFADLIAENHERAFLTCSDAHSPWPYRMGREFTRIEMKKPSFGELKKALLKERERIQLNVGLDPREGKYHCTACNRCYSKYTLENAVKLRWRCPRCKGTIKKGVRDRILELASFSEEVHPAFRPSYLHIIPLAEIIKLALNVENINALAVQNLWRELVSYFGSEIKVLVDVPIIDIAEINEQVANKIESFREKRVLYIGGGGGKYGQPIICDSEEELERKKIELADTLECSSSFRGQKTLNEF
jgi:uncharacterized protein (TIGR00375 family)